MEYPNFINCEQQSISSQSNDFSIHYYNNVIVILEKLEIEKKLVKKQLSKIKNKSFSNPKYENCMRKKHLIKRKIFDIYRKISKEENLSGQNEVCSYKTMNFAKIRFDIED